MTNVKNGSLTLPHKTNEDESIASSVLGTSNEQESFSRTLLKIKKNCDKKKMSMSLLT